VAGRLAEEIKQTKPFASVEEELLLNILRTAEVVTQTVQHFLKGYQLSHTQYNVLRILRGAARSGRTCSELGERLITRDPDVTRLTDRLVARGLVERERSEQDRRIVITRITARGLELLDSMDAPIADILRDTIGKLPKQAQAELIERLEQVRELFT